MRSSSAFSPFHRAFCAVACAALVAGLAAAAVAAECTPWPGEPVPVPTTASADALEAKWAALRASELAALATRLETTAPADAARLWTKALCLDPRRADAREAAERTAVVRVHRPEVARADLPDTLAASDVAAALDRLDRPIYLGRQPRVAGPPAPQVAAAQAGASGGAPKAPAASAPEPVRAVDAPTAVVPAPPALATRSGEPGAPIATPPPVSAPPTETQELAAADGLLDQAETLLREARFEEALDRAARARAALPRADGAALRARRARAEVVTGTAEVALGREGDARESFQRAVRTDPSLKLDPAQTSPKVLRAFDAAKAGSAP